MLVVANCQRARSLAISGLFHARLGITWFGSASGPGSQQRTLAARQLVFHDLALARPESCRDPRRDHGDSSAAHAAEVEEMHPEIHQERDQPREPVTPDLAHRPAASHHRERSLVEVLEWLRRAGLALPDRLGHMPGLLNRG